jgi:hypothetical protein
VMYLDELKKSTILNSNIILNEREHLTQYLKLNTSIQIR